MERRSDQWMITESDVIIDTHTIHSKIFAMWPTKSKVIRNQNCIICHNCFPSRASSFYHKLVALSLRIDM